MVIIDGSFLLGVAAVVTSIANLWRAIRDWRGVKAGQHSGCPLISGNRRAARSFIHSIPREA